MKGSKKNIRLNWFCAFNLALLAIALVSSCGKKEVSSPTSSSIQLLIRNLSPDAYPVDFYQNNVKKTRHIYGGNDDYFTLTETGYPLQLRSTRANDFVLTDTTKLKSNTRYSLFLTGLYSDKTYGTILTVDDTASLPPTGKGGKIRFLNASPRAPGFDVYANGTLAFKNIAYSKLSPYVVLPPGSYNFRLYSTGANATTATSLNDLNNVIIQDGRLYTLYSSGLLGRTDSATLVTKVISNNTLKR